MKSILVKIVAFIMVSAGGFQLSDDSKPLELNNEIANNAVVMLQNK